MAMRPSSFIILLVYLALIVLALLMPFLFVMVTRLEKHVNLKSQNFVTQLQSQVDEYSVELFNPLKSSSTNLATFLTSSLHSTNNTSFSNIQTKVAPLLFQAIETIPHLTQISYMGIEGLFISYLKDNNGEAIVMYSNSSFMGGASSKTLYYIQPVNRENGEVYGEAKICNHDINTSLINESFNNSNGFASLGTKWFNNSELLFINSAKVNGSKGMISLGYSTKAMTNFLTSIDRQGVISYLATKDGKVIVQGIQNTRLVMSNDSVVSFQYLNDNGDLIRNIEGNVSCKGEVGSSSTIKIWDNHYLIHCYPIDIMGIQAVHVLAIPENGIIIHYKEKGLIIMLIVMMVMILIAILSFALSNVGIASREMYLSSSLIKQMEATQQAERKNLNKSHALAVASHDVRAFLACLIGLIDMSYKLVLPSSELDTNLKQMDACTKDLLGLLNSILDTSKIEAGKMQLEEVEFDVSHLLEDVVDLYYPIAMKKGVDLVLDHCNGSVIRYSGVKGDRGRLKQVLCNLLSNAVKFTDKGHITVRAWVQEATLQKTWSSSSCLFYKKKNNNDLEKGMNSIQHDPNSVDFVFEVDDTGKGIPRENRKSVFENYVQVKDSAVGQVGTGLGLGIVQSLVRLMHGEIEIVEKDHGEKGTCFRFNVSLTLCTTREGVVEGGQGRRTIHATSSGSSPRLEPSCVVLYIENDERRRISQMFMERLGIKVKVVKDWKNHLYDTLKKIKQQKGGYNSNSQSSSDSNSPCSSYARAKRIPFRSMDGSDYLSSVFKKTNNGSAPGFILVIIDANGGPFSELCTFVSDFKKDLSNPCKIVWLDKPLVSSSIDWKQIDEDDIVISKPFHGRCLFQVIELLPEYVGNFKTSCSLSRDSTLSKYKGKEIIEEFGESSNNNKPLNGKKFLVVKDNGVMRKVAQQGEIIEECGESSNNNKPLNGKKFLVVKDNGVMHKVAQQGEIIEECGESSNNNKLLSDNKILVVEDDGVMHNVVQQEEIIEECGESSNNNKPLSGKKFLVVDDNRVFRNVAMGTLMKLGATFDQCENGEEAVRLVGEVLNTNTPYDYILMDGQMPVMDGFEATRRIREMERCHDGVPHIPIIALSADTGKTTIESGMDFHIDKPITGEKLLEAITYIHNKRIHNKRSSMM